MTARTIVASVVSTVVIATPAGIQFWLDLHSGSSEPNDSWQRGMVFFPVFLVAVALACSFVGRWLVVNGHTSILAFSTRAVAIAMLLWFTLVLPSVFLVVYLEMVGFGEALFAAFLFGALFIASVAPATAAWWLVAVRMKPQVSESAA
jgi:hypothetical protein